VLPGFSSEVDEKLIELVRKCEELYDMSNKKYSDSVWKEELWRQIGEELKKSGKRILKLPSFYYHLSFNNLQITKNAFCSSGRIWLITYKDRVE
jgi:hypothetical protein